MSPPRRVSASGTGEAAGSMAAGEVPAEADTLPPVLLAPGLEPADLAAALPGLTLLPLEAAAGAPEPALCLATADGAQAAAEALAARGLTHLPVAVWQGEPAALLAPLAAALAAARRDAGEARRAAALLRRESEALNRRFKALEGFAWTLGGPAASLALSWPPGAEAGAATADAPIRQALPVDVSALAAVELLAPELTDDEARSLDVAIEDAEGRRHPLVLAETSVERGDGWLRFAADLPLAIDPQDGTLVASGAPADAVFGLGPPVPDPAFAVQGLAVPEPATLALRVWKGVTGSAGAMAPTAPPVSGLLHERLMPSDLPEPAIIARPRSAHDHVEADFWVKENAFLVHPSARGPVCALVARVPVAGIERASALIHAAHPRSAVLGFALGFAATGQATPDNWDEFLGDWVYLAPGSWGEVQARPKARGARTGRMCDLLLATCVAGDAPNDNGWALFRGFRLSRRAPE